MAKVEAILVVNAGSSSLKFQLFEISKQEPKRMLRGQISGIGHLPRLTLQDSEGNVQDERTWTAGEMADLPAAILYMSDLVRSLQNIRLHAIGHRVVHGGPDYAEPVRIKPKILENLAAYQDLAPLHQPNNLAPVRLAMEIAPALPQIACFDTAFHRDHAKHTECYAIPLDYYDAGVRRYGFHGLSYEYISKMLPKVAPNIANGRVIVAHLGSGASMCALRNQKSVETTMGFTALDGLPMGTRSGQLDPGVVLYLIEHLGMTPQQVNKLLYDQSGLIGLSGISSDMRTLLASDDARAKLAVDHFLHRCNLHFGMLTASLGGLDGIVFTAGIGENSPEIRARLCAKLKWQNVMIDPEANQKHVGLISTPDSGIEVHVIPTDEEAVIAHRTMTFVTRSREI